MNDYLLLMHADATDPDAADDDAAWIRYLDALRAGGGFDGGSAIGRGERHRRGTAPRPAEPGPSGYLRVRAASLEDARRYLQGNPVYEAGGTVEIRELPRGP